MRKLVERLLMYLLGVVSLALVLYFTYPQPDNLDRWYKISTDDPSLGMVALDMSKGYSYSEFGYIFIVVKDAENGDQIVVAFPDGAYWSAPTVGQSNELSKGEIWAKDY